MFTSGYFWLRFKHTSTYNFILSRTTISLYIYISGDICKCATDGSLRGHPENCMANVICIQGEQGVMYPLGAACQQAGWCRNSITGACADNCSAAICMEEVPSGRLCISFLLPEKTNLRQSYVIYCSV
jgi:hypothetical protein